MTSGIETCVLMFWSQALAVLSFDQKNVHGLLAGVDCTIDDGWIGTFAVIPIFDGCVPDDGLGTLPIDVMFQYVEPPPVT
jgi:hypothetical protein